MGELPTGTVTFLFTDIEGSTRLLQDLGARWRGIVEEHNRLLREAIRDAGGVDVRTEGDSFFAVFASAPAAIEAAAAAQRALAAHPWPPEATIRVRMGMHTGEGAVGGDDYGEHRLKDLARPDWRLARPPWGPPGRRVGR